MGAGGNLHERSMGGSCCFCGSSAVSHPHEACIQPGKLDQSPKHGSTDGNCVACSLSDCSACMPVHWLVQTFMNIDLSSSPRCLPCVWQKIEALASNRSRTWARHPICTSAAVIGWSSSSADICRHSEPQSAVRLLADMIACLHRAPAGFCKACSLCLRLEFHTDSVAECTAALCIFKSTRSVFSTNCPATY